MEPKAKSAVWVILLFVIISPGCFSQEFIVTDAAGGIFAEDQNPSFSISGPGWLRLLLDTREIYRGKGPAYPELGVNRGEERGFSLRAEYYSPVDELLESLSWHIFIDKKIPSIPEMEIRNTLEGLRLFKSGGESNAKIRAWADIDGNLVFFPDLGEDGLLPADSFSALIWAEDLAGNFSLPRFKFFDISPVKIDNPVPGEWLNPQTLIISGAEGENVYWTVDGSHPLEPGGTGRLFQGPERIERYGQITLRIAWRDSVGRIREARTVYSVTGSSEVSLPGSLDLFRLAEENTIRSAAALPLPENYLWSMGAVPSQEGGGSLNLRPEAFIRRVAALQLSPVSAGGGGVYRFAYLLDGIGNWGIPGNPISAAAGVSRDESLLYPSVNPNTPGSQSQRYVMDALRLFSAGRSRTIIWPELPGTIYYSWRESRGEPWLEGKGPLLVPLEGGALSWFVVEREREDEPGKAVSPVAGPYSVTIASLARGRTEKTRGRIACRNYYETGNAGWEYVSGLIDYTPGIVKDRNDGKPPDVCDGEDLEWAFISTGGTILEQQRRDRLAPPAPSIAAIPEGGWSRGPVKVSVISDEKDITGVISARLHYASGIAEILSGTGSLDIVSGLGELADVTVECYLVDVSGNRSPITIRRFTLDPKIVYVSAEPLITGTPENSAVRGGMDNPFTSLEEALDFAVRMNLVDIRIAGIQELRKPVTIPGKIRIDGAWRKEAPGGEKAADSRAALVLGNGFFWNVESGGRLELFGLRMERKAGDNPLIQAGKNTKLEITGTAINNTGPFLIMDGGACGIRDSGISIKVSGERRIAAFTARLSGMDLSGSRIQLEADYSLLFDLRGGSFSAAGCIFLAAGRRTASLFSLNGTRGNFNSLTLHAAAGDYASVLEASGSELVISGGIMEVSARDVTSFLFENTVSLIHDARIRLEASFSAKAAEIRGYFPLVRNSGFYSEGTAKKSEVFSGTETAAPPASGITGNRFSGFTHIWGEGWPMEKLSAFNRDYASPERPNTVALRP